MDPSGDDFPDDLNLRDPNLVDASFTGDDAALDARLERLLRGLPDADPDGPLPDPSRVASHFAGVGDQALLEEAAARSSVRRLLGEVAEDVAGAEAEFAVARAAAGAKGHVPARDDEASVAAATAAFAASLVPASQRAGARDDDADAEAPSASRAPLRVLPAAPVARRRGLAWAAAAAVLVAVPLALSSRAVEAGPVLALSGVDRLDADGALAAEGPREASVGARFASEGGERVSLRLPGGARVVLSGGAAHVAADGRFDALLALDRGEAVLAAGAALEHERRRSAGAAVLLPDGSRLEATSGAAHVAVRADGAVAVDVRGGASARWTPAGTAVAPVELAGAAAYLLPRGAREPGGREAPRGEGLSPGRAEALFRDLQFFGGDLTPAVSERWTTARFWRVLKAPAGSAVPAAVARVSDDDGVPALRLDLAVRGEEASEARIAWRPDEEALAASRLLVLLRARPASAGAGALPDPDARSARVTVALLGEDGREIARGEVVAGPDRAPAAGESADASSRRLELALPADFAARAARGELVLAFRGAGASSVVRFTGASFKPPRDAASVPSPE